MLFLLPSREKVRMRGTLSPLSSPVKGEEIQGAPLMKSLALTSNRCKPYDFEFWSFDFDIV